jgi:hypothetical protein
MSTDLEKVAIELVNQWLDADVNDLIGLKNSIVEALKQARQSALPSEERLEQAATAYYEGYLSDTPLFENARTRWMKHDFMNGAWSALRLIGDNLKGKDET